MSKINQAPKYTVLEQVALALATTWYEVGRSNGMTSKFKDAKSYARANFEKFLPKSIEYCLQMLNRSDIHDLQKQEIYEALLERHNDPTLCDAMPNIPNIDISKLLPKHDRLPDVNTVLHNNINPYMKKGH